MINRARKSLYPKDKVFANVYKNFNEKETSLTERPPLTTPFVPQRKDVDRSTLYSFKGPFEALQADIADIQFLAKSAVDPKYCLLFVDLFTAMIYTYPMKTRNLLAKKMGLLYNDIKYKRMGRMCLQTDLELQQNNIKKLNEENDVEMYSTKIRGGKAFAAEQKIRELKICY